jgi:hypothetical protein
MNSFIPVKKLRSGLLLISAAFLLHGNGALAAEAEGDAQSQARDLLSGTVGGRARVVDASPAMGAGGAMGADGAMATDGVGTPGLDPQEQARQLILGKPTVRRIEEPLAALEPQTNVAPAVLARGGHRTYADPQDSARRMILGSGARGTASPASKRSASLTQEPLVMRLNKNEFRIAFGIDAGRLSSNGCNGDIRYRVNWKTQDGAMRSEIRRVNYTVLPGTSRTIAVDHQFFDAAEGQQTTDVVGVKVARVTCVDSRALQTASAATQEALPRSGAYAPRPAGAEDGS